MSDSQYEYLGRRGHHTLIGRQNDTPLERALTHRIAVMRMLPGSAEQGRCGMACVLGAGECHDLDLQEMLKRFHEVHLVDRNGESMTAGLEQQKLNSHVRIIRHDGIDISGADALLDEFATSRDGSRIVKLLSQKMPVSLKAMGQFDVLISANMMPELMARAVSRLGIEDPHLAQVLASLRVAHIETMLNMTRPGGQAFLVTELSTSQHIPELVAAPDDLNAILMAPESVRRMNPGCNPAIIDRVLRETPAIIDRIERYDMSIPWLRQEKSCTSAFLAYRMTVKA